MPRKEPKKWENTKGAEYPSFPNERLALRYARQAVGPTGCSTVLIDGKLAEVRGNSIYFKKPTYQRKNLSEVFSEEKQAAWDAALLKISRKPRKSKPSMYSLEYYLSEEN